MPSTATLVLMAWPLVVVVLFRRLPVPKALAISIVAGYLLVPTQPMFDLPLLPTYDRRLAAALPALVMAFLLTRPSPVQAGSAAPPSFLLEGWLPKVPILRICFLVVLVSPFFTVMTNGDPLNYGFRSLPAQRPYDAGSAVLGALCTLLPFILARKYLSQPREQAMLLGVLCVAALAYSLPTLYEVRMSPQINRMIYGFSPSSWVQHLRGDGYRPVVFLEHGLRLGIFLTVAIIASAGFMRCTKPEQKPLLIGALIWLLATLVLAKTLGALLIAIVLLPVALFLGSRTQLLVAGILAGMVLAYPMLRAVDLVPTQSILSFVGAISSENRVGSLGYRFTNEDLLLEKANERPLFGWGGWGRARVYDERGRGGVATDGIWIIEFGERGWVGYLAKFGLLTLPIIMLALRRRSGDLPLATSVLTLALTANLIDLLPNSALTPLTWLMAGSLVGRLEKAPEQDPKPEADTEASPEGRKRLPYRRQFPQGRAPAFRRDERPPPLRSTAAQEGSTQRRRRT